MTVRGIDLPAKPDVWIGDDNIVYADLRGFRHLTLDLVHYIHRQRRRLASQKRMPLLLLAKDILTIDFEVQLYASHPDMQLATQALAIVGDSFMLRHIVSVFVSYHAPDYPVALFSDQNDACEWLGIEKSNDKQLG